MIDEGLILDAALGPHDAALDAEAEAVAALGVELGCVGFVREAGRLVGVSGSSSRGA